MWSPPPGKNQSACWIIGSMMLTICRDKVVIISVMFLEQRQTAESLQNDPRAVKFHMYDAWKQWDTYGSVCVQSKLGPRTMAMLPGVILFASWYSLSLAKNLIRYLWDLNRKKVYIQCIYSLFIYLFSVSHLPPRPSCRRRLQILHKAGLLN